MFGFLIILFIVALIVTGLSYNSLQKLSQDIREKASNAQVSVSKKLTLINQLIEVVKNYQTAEQMVHLKVSQDATQSNLEGAYHQSGSVFSTIQGMADRFPNLKADSQYHRLIHSIQECEKDIQYCREKYNQSVKLYNTKRLTIPTVFIAKSLGFSDAPYLEFDHSGVQEVSTLKDFTTDDGERLQKIFSGAGDKIKNAAKDMGKVGKDFADKMKKE